MEKKEQHNYALIAIVAIVAIIALVVLVMNVNKGSVGQTYTLPSGLSSSGDIGGGIEQVGGGIRCRNSGEMCSAFATCCDNEGDCINGYCGGSYPGDNCNGQGESCTFGKCCPGLTCDGGKWGTNDKGTCKPVSGI